MNISRNPPDASGQVGQPVTKVNLRTLDAPMPSHDVRSHVFSRDALAGEGRAQLVGVMSHGDRTTRPYRHRQVDGLTHKICQGLNVVFVRQLKAEVLNLCSEAARVGRFDTDEQPIGRWAAEP